MTSQSSKSKKSDSPTGNGGEVKPYANGDGQRLQLMDELYRRYGGDSGFTKLSNRLRFWRKKYAWSVVVNGANVVKRTIDILASGLLLTGLFPFFLVVAVAIKLTDGGPVLFWQSRVGKWGREFAFPKFRSMVVDAEKVKAALLDQSHHENSITFKMEKDPRITWIGRIIRKVSIDELPQLWNVLKGDMSLVGPRPPVPQEVEMYTLSDRRRLDITPGITCQMQVMPDIKILLKTIPAVLTGKGAY